MKTQKREEYRTTIVFSLKDKVGALCDALKPFGTHKINLTRIVSRPSAAEEWRYIFFIEIKGRKTNPKVKKALTGLEKRSSSIHVLGSYPLRKI